MTTSLPSMPYAPRSPEGLAARWVQWAATPSFFRSPIGDDTGARAALHQPDDVWFLAGSYGGDPVVRQCRVPVGRELFLPVFNTWFVDHGPEVLERAGGRLTVDGEDLTREVIATPQPFVVRGGFLNGVTRSRKPKHMTVWGLWKLVPPSGPVSTICTWWVATGTASSSTCGTGWRWRRPRPARTEVWRVRPGWWRPGAPRPGRLGGHTHRTARELDHS